MDYSIKAGWPFDRRVNFNYEWFLELNQDAVESGDGPGDMHGGRALHPDERMHGWRRIGWDQESRIRPEEVMNGSFIPLSKPCVVDLHRPTGYPIVLDHRRGRAILQWPLSVQHRPQSPLHTMFEDSYYYDANGWVHRADGPAILMANGTQVWMHRGVVHRKDGPAVILPDGSMVWMQFGQLHRDGGPAIEWSDGTRAWYRDGCPIDPNE